MNKKKYNLMGHILLTVLFLNFSKITRYNEYHHGPKHYRINRDYDHKNKPTLSINLQ